MVDVYEKLSERLQSVNHVVTAFRQYLDDNDRSKIKNLPNDILEKTLNLHASSKGDRESGWYKAIEQELARREKSRERSKDHWV